MSFSMFVRDRFLDEFSMAFFTDFGPDSGCRFASVRVKIRNFFDPFPRGVFLKVPWLTLGSLCLPFGSLRLPFRSPWLPFGSLLASFGSLSAHFLAPFGLLWHPFGSVVLLLAPTRANRFRKICFWAPETASQPQTPVGILAAVTYRSRARSGICQRQFD